jgi:hypothetical protein
MEETNKIFQSNNNHLLHREAIDLVVKNLPGAIPLDAIVNKDLKKYTGIPYHIEWNGLKLLIKVARPSRKISQKRAKWFYTLRDKDHKVADFFILFCLFKSKIEAIYVIPKVFSPKVFITITRLNGNMRYDYFRTTIQDLSSKIMEVKNSLPKLAKIYREAEGLEGGKL